jgi:uncharacterized membrane protein YbhN (UPF0104 family)
VLGRSVPKTNERAGIIEISLTRKVWQHIKSFLPWAITCLLLGYIFIYKVEFLDVFNAVKLVNLSIFIPIILIVFMIGTFASTFFYYLAFNWLAAKASFKEIFYARGAIHVLSIINFALEQGGLGYWLARKKSVSGGQAFSTIFFIMIMGGFLIMCLSTVGLLLMPEVKIGHLITGGPGAGLLRFTTIYIVFSIVEFIIWITKPKTRFLRFMFRGPFIVFHKLRLRHFIIMFLLNLVPFTSFIIGAWMGLSAFGVSVPFRYILTYVPIIELIAVIPVTVMGLGTTQVAWIKFFEGLVSAETIVAFSMLWAVMTIFLRSILSLCCLPKALGDYRLVRAEQVDEC